MESKALLEPICLPRTDTVWGPVSGRMGLGRPDTWSLVPFPESWSLGEICTDLPVAAASAGAGLAGQLLPGPSSVLSWRQCRSREVTEGPARFPPTQTSVQDKVRRGCATGQQHNKSPPASSRPHCSRAAVVLSMIKRKEEHCAIRLGKKDALLTAPVALGRPHFKYEETEGQHAA